MRDLVKEEGFMRVKREATIGIAMIPVIFMMAALAFAMLVTNVWQIGWIDVQIPLIISTFVASLIGVFVLGYSWGELEIGIVELLKSALSAIMIIMIIGILVGTWLVSGIVPTMIYYGLQILSPSVFLVVSLLLCSLVSVSTGSSWITAGTVGIALMGIGQGMGIPAPVVGGCVISGAYFGDKMSPLSDTTNLASGVAQVKLFDHIRHMLYTTGPSYIISIIFFTVLGIKYSSGTIDASGIEAMLLAIKSTFYIHPILLIAPVFVIVMIVFKVPAIPGLFVGSLIGAAFAGIFQGVGLIDIIDAMHYGVSYETGNAIIDELVSGGGLDGMMWTISLLFCSMAFGGVMEVTGMLGAIAGSIMKLANKTGDVILATIFTCLAINLVTGDQYLAIVIPGRMYSDEYEKRSLHSKNLSRSLEDAATITSPLIPWNSCGAYMIPTLGLTPWTYVPYCIFNIVNPIIAIIIGYMGFGIADSEVKEVTV